jgi:Ulp1 family protease
MGCLLNGRFKGGEEKSQLVIFDSGYGGVAMGPLLRVKLMNLYKILEGADMDIEVVSASNIPYQNNSYDCGIFTIGFGEYILKELVSQLD